MKNSSHSEKIIHARHRVVRWTPSLLLVACGLALTLALLWVAHPSLAPVSEWHWLRLGWLGGLAATVICGLVLWRVRRRTELLTAAEMDATLASCNRLETATALRTAQDPMAKAQRAETEEFLQRGQIVPRRRWLAMSALLVALLAMAHLATLICWARPVHVDAKAKKDAPAVAEKRKEAPAAPTASIEWRSPESETSATAIEEVPLEADADSSTGLRNAVLEVEVNGAHQLTQPLTNDLAKAGVHTLKPSIFLDQLDVKTYDIVSYHISAQRIADAALPPTVSPVQFVQVKPVREDTFICKGGDQPSKCFNYVTALKAAQLRLMKDNFTLAHADVSHDNTEWSDENARVGGDQNNLASRTSEVIELMRTNNYPEQILSLVRESQPLMTDAGAKIVREENQPALQPQGQALGYLTEVEKYLKNSIKLAGQSLQPKAADPFQRPKHLDLKTHPLTRAGKLDALAKAQSELAGDLARGNTNAALELASQDQDNPAADVTGTPGERQSKIKEHISDFLSDPAIQAEALKHLQAGDALAGKAEEQIQQNDLAAASEPAAEAARELHQTAEALRAGDNQAAKNKLADALLRLAAAAGNVRRAPQAKTDAAAAAELKKTEDAINEAAKQLAAEAQRQQENGATNAATRLDELAKLMAGGSLKQMLAQAQAAPRDAAQTEALAKKLDDLAQRAGEQRNPGELSRQELARLVDRMQRTQTNLKNLAAQCSQCSNPGTSPGKGSGKSGESAVPGGQNGRSQPGPSSKPNPSSNPASASTASSGSTGGSNEPAHARGPELSRADMQRAEGAQLLDELRLDSAEARAGSSDLIYAKKLDEVLRNAAGQEPRDPKDYAPLVLELDPPLTGVIHSLQTKLAGMRRQFELAAKEPAGALPAYREAVADYFEQVSRDYQPENKQ
ncbi:MAG TPA: hypothetical protein VF988_05885 [Verrucomicrobiae bacterium]